MDKPYNIHTFLTNKKIGISISESEDIESLGFSEAHLQDAKIEIARHLLSTGAMLMYGGDLRDNGYTRTLFELVESYSPGEIDEDRLSLINYLGWPLDITLTDELRASLSQKIQFELPGLPSDLSSNLSKKKYLTPDNPKMFYTWARSMTYMREAMTKSNHARIVLGGKSFGFKGKYPGVVEEVYLSMKANKPTYLIGAFGGISSDVISALKGKTPSRLTNKYQLSTEKLTNNAAYYETNRPPRVESINYTKLVDFFNNRGIKGLNNGLTEEENKRLFKTIHIPEMVSLILKGLVTVFMKDKKI
tara:strand:+ start:1615 stop:2526 length:912 start_codon:yes stop_codon:yes gene_type:complete